MTNLSGNARGNLPGAGGGNLSGAADGPESAAAQLVGRARVMMVISGLTTALAIAAVVTVIGYRMFAGASAVSGDGIVTLPKGAHIISAVASAGRIAVLLDVDGATELRTFDIKTLKPTGRIRFATEP
jgi:hypothetical protein